MRTTLEITTIQTQEYVRPVRHKAIPPGHSSKRKIKTEIGILDTHITYVRRDRFFDVECGQSFSIINI